MLKKPFITLFSALLFTGSLAQPCYGAADKKSEYYSPDDFRKVAREAIPAVVAIKVKSSGKAASQSGYGENSDDPSDFSADEFWQHFFGFNRRGGSTEQQPVMGQASGFIISPDGYVLTNDHVVKDMTEITVIANDGKEYTAKVVGQDPNTDIALIKIDGKNLPFLTLGNSDDLEVGQPVAAIGNPLGLQASLTKGVVSAKGRNNLDLSPIDYIQTDAAINRGNSGGPLLDHEAKVVGMNTAILTNATNGGYMGIGFAIPSNMLKIVSDELKSGGTFKRGYVGVVLQPVDSDLAQAFGTEKAEGALVAEVAKDSPAEKAGIKQGDIIVKYNNTQINNIGALRSAISMMKPGSQITLSILRNGKPLAIQVEIGLFPSGETLAVSKSTKDLKLGIEVENLKPEIAGKLGYTNDKGVLISKVDPSSPAAWVGIKKGALILEINQKKVSNVDEFNSAMKETGSGKPILLLIKQGDMTRFVSLKIG